jgi:hypothetical protein
MPAYFFVIGKNSNLTTREFSDNLRSSILQQDLYSKIGAIEVIIKLFLFKLLI